MPDRPMTPDEMREYIVRLENENQRLQSRCAHFESAYQRVNDENVTAIKRLAEHGLDVDVRAFIPRPDDYDPNGSSHA